MLYVLYVLTTDINFNINIRQQEKYIIQSNCLINTIYQSIEKSLIRKLYSRSRKTKKRYL